MLSLMQVWLYSIVTQAYFMAIRLASAFGSERAKNWVNGRKGYWPKLAASLSEQRTTGQPLVWVHCASLGEFEQGRPIIEAIKQRHPSYFVLLTFFSPSGYEVRKNYPLADHIAYLPPDSSQHAKSFLKIADPSLAIFVKYEFWWHFLNQLRVHGVPTILVSAIFRPGQPFFKWYGNLHRKMLGCFQTIFVQDGDSKDLLGRIGLGKQVVVAGDNRVDRVLEIASKPLDLPLVAQFCGNSPVLIGGSTWEPDERLLGAWFNSKTFQDWKCIIAPHDVRPERLAAIEAGLSTPHVRYSKLAEAAKGNERILLIDNIGLLSSLYKFGKIAYIGGGFGHGIHNTLEPAAHGLPILFGPKYKKFEEANWFVKHGGGFVVTTPGEFQQVFTDVQNERKWSIAAQKVSAFIEQRKGATMVVMAHISQFLKA